MIADNICVANHFLSIYNTLRPTIYQLVWLNIWSENQLWIHIVLYKRLDVLLWNYVICSNLLSPPLLSLSNILPSVSAVKTVQYSHGGWEINRHMTRESVEERKRKRKRKRKGPCMQRKTDGLWRNPTIDKRNRHRLTHTRADKKRNKHESHCSLKPRALA